MMLTDCIPVDVTLYVLLYTPSLQSMPGSHALLLGSKGTGRHSLAKMITHIMDGQVMAAHSI